MFKKAVLRKSGVSLPDVFAVTLLLGGFLALLTVARYWTGPLQSAEPVDLTLESLPYATFLSLSRIAIAYVVCLVTSVLVGYWAAHSKVAEKIIVPMIDIGQSIPVLGFLPGLVIAFLALFPNSRVGLEIAAVLTLYTGMAWNLMLSFYGSIKTIPREYVDIVRAYGYGPLGQLLRLELPWATNGLVWNSMLSVAGGWFFLTVCESYTIGDTSFRLVGLGSFMALAAERGDWASIAAGVSVMVMILVATDYFVWKPLLRWAERFQKAAPDEDQEEEENVIAFFAKSKWITSFLRKFRRRHAVQFYVNRRGKKSRDPYPWAVKAVPWIVLAVFTAVSVWAVWMSVTMVAGIPAEEWRAIGANTLWTSLRVTAALLVAALVMIPLGLWLGTHPALVKRMQSIIQVVAAFPAPMIFPLLISVFLFLRVPMEVGAVVLMLTGAQWYLLFNVISGAASVPENLVEVARLSGMGSMGLIRRVFLPAAFPSILTGMITAAGGAWNTSIVAELVIFRGERYEAAGLGSYIARAAYEARYPELIAAVTIMVVVIVLVNRLVWARLYDLAENRYRLD
ncbi:MAG: ABC transporter permease subunit [Bdellovibrionales bacterium]|nr:ABC transporter permease subunit [Bdellovibrionales bacterium]